MAEWPRASLRPTLLSFFSLPDYFPGLLQELRLLLIELFLGQHAALPEGVEFL